MCATHIDVRRRFKPKVNDKVPLFGSEYAVQPHPSADKVPFSSEGKRATVYQLRSSSNELFALKVFKKRFRLPNLVSSAKLLTSLETIEGMTAAKRQIVLPDGHQTTFQDDLCYAMLMAWIVGETWFDILQKAQAGFYIRESTAIHLCLRFLNVVAGLERRAVAHCDISPANVMVDLSINNIELLDLEEIYMSKVAFPKEGIRGTFGYSHQSADDNETLWCAAGDRYAAAVLAAEMLVLANQHLSSLASEDGYFLGNCRSDTGNSRYRLAEPWLTSVAPEFAKLFRRSWFSVSLSECPKVATLCSAIRQTANRTPVDTGTILKKRVPVVMWEPLDFHRGFEAENQAGSLSEPPRVSVLHAREPKISMTWVVIGLCVIILLIIVAGIVRYNLP